MSRFRVAGWPDLLRLAQHTLRRTSELWRSTACRRVELTAAEGERDPDRVGLRFGMTSSRRSLHKAELPTLNRPSSRSSRHISPSELWLCRISWVTGKSGGTDDVYSEIFVSSGRSAARPFRCQNRGRSAAALSAPFAGWT